MKTGLDRVAAREEAVVMRLEGQRVGVLAHAASVDARLRHCVDLVRGCGAEVCALFGPEHGFFATAQDMIGVDGDEVEASSGIPTYSLYGSTEDALYPKDAWLAGLDAVVIDLQDVGARYYTYIWTAAIMLRACAAAGVRTIVFDRPNPLGGAIVEGAPQREGYLSFVGYEPVAVRHGMTIAEILKMVQMRDGLAPEALEVVSMSGWKRSMQWTATGLPWVMPSPNMPTTDTAYVYPGGCLLEATNLSEGRGTTRPFELWGAPFVDADALMELQIEGAVLRPVQFEPTFHKWANQICTGVFPHVTDPSTFRPYEAYLQMIDVVYRSSAERGFAWRTEAYEFVTDRPAIDLLTGGPEFRDCLESEGDLGSVLQAERQGAEQFDEARQPYLLYGVA